ncbi:NRDE family protein [Pseudomonas lalucatii]|uniref:NRDE family protein n=1 Tax=Pseudomonas lalucatii TaxID=1424203 RepID=A0ABS5Q2A0_9PSED|nr:NRDE family protein [Pseudomonas lalucatii]MBS7662872.1 NRDE family protein [Pseudomonas lalucatii]
MCLIVFAWRPSHPLPLVLAANRDEFYERPSQPLAAWEDAPNIYGGRDLQAGGTWLAAGPQGRYAALTNIRDPRQPPFGRSRGELPLQFLQGELEPEAFLTELAERAGNYSAFNLLVGDAKQLWFLNSREGIARQLEEGLYGFSNADLDTPWPKVEKGKALLSECLVEPQVPALLDLLHDAQQPPDSALPDTGVGLNTERLLSGIFIATRSYGTLASTALLVRADGSRQLVERRYGPLGVPLGETSLEC